MFIYIEIRFRLLYDLKAIFDYALFGKMTQNKYLTNQHMYKFTFLLMYSEIVVVLHFASIIKLLFKK